jgi:hypothetical protein
MMDINLMMLLLQNAIKSLDVANLSRGGCGHFAEYCYRFLKARGLPVQIVFFDEADLKAYYEDVVRNNQILEYGCAHVMVRIGNIYIDGDGVHEGIPRYWSKYGEPVVLPHRLLVLWNQESVWNPSFRRSDIPRIQEFFENLKIAA